MLKGFEWRTGGAAVLPVPGAKALFAIPRDPGAEPFPFSPAWREGAGLLVKSFREAIAAIGSVYAWGYVAMFFLPLFRPEATSRMAVVEWLHVLMDPPLAAVTDFMAFRPAFYEFDFLLLGLALGVRLSRNRVTDRLRLLESRIYRPLRLKAREPYIPDVVAGGGASLASRLRLLGTYVTCKRMLSAAEKEMAFLSVDVAGSTQMKREEEKLSVEYAFTEYKKFVKQIFQDCRVYRMSWTPDGFMAAFASVDDAATAARRLLTDLDRFNREVNILRREFHVRCGLSFGEVLFPEDKPLPEITDEVLDIAGQLQRSAEPDSLWVSEEAYGFLQNRRGFAPRDTLVENRAVFSWQGE